MTQTAKQTAPSPTFTLNADYFFTAVSSWLIPGAGHWLLGYRVRGAVLCVSIVGLFWVGEALAMPEEGPFKPIAVSRKISPVFFGCQIGNGFCTLLADSLWGKPDYDKDRMAPLDRSLPRYLNLGILFTSVSGLLNLLIVLHILDPRTWAQAAVDRGGVVPAPDREAAGGGKQAEPGRGGGTA